MDGPDIRLHSWRIPAKAQFVVRTFPTQSPRFLDCAPSAMLQWRVDTIGIVGASCFKLASKRVPSQWHSSFASDNQPHTWGGGQPSVAKTGNQGTIKSARHDEIDNTQCTTSNAGIFENHHFYASDKGGSNRKMDWKTSIGSFNLRISTCEPFRGPSLPVCKKSKDKDKSALGRPSLNRLFQQLRPTSQCSIGHSYL